MLLLACWGVASSIILPRALSDHIQIITIDRTGGSGSLLGPLRPVSGNITQAGYILVDALVFLSVRELFKQGALQESKLARAVLALAAVNVGAAIVNVCEFYLHLPPLLSHVRTGGYVIFDSYEIGGLVRIQGTFAEASHFAVFTLPLFAYCFSLWRHGATRYPWSGRLAVALLALLLLSTSGTAYVALGAYLALFAIGYFLRGAVSKATPRSWALSLIATVSLAVICVVVVFASSRVERAWDYVDTVVFSKLSSSSGQERAAFNRQAWTNFIETYGLGVGLGTARASSFPLVLLSNLGVVGIALFGAFIKNVLWHTRNVSMLSAEQRAARQAVIGALLATSASGFVFDLGIAFYVFAAAASIPSALGPSSKN